MKEMPDEEALALGIAIFLAVFLGVPAISIVAHDGWIEGVKKLDTLIGGLLAVLAALYTVRQMRASDAAQNERHLHLLRIQTIKERRLLRRARLELDELVAIYGNVPKPFVLPEDAASLETIKMTSEIKRLSTEVLKRLDRPTIKEAEPYFDLALTYSIGNARHFLRSVLNDYDESRGSLAMMLTMFQGAELHILRLPAELHFWERGIDAEFAIPKAIEE